MVNGTEGKKNYDGSYTYTIDVSKKDYNDYIEVQKWWNGEYSTFRYLSIQFKKEYTLFDYYAYKFVCPEIKDSRHIIDTVVKDIYRE